MWLGRGVVYIQDIGFTHTLSMDINGNCHDEVMRTLPNTQIIALNLHVLEGGAQTDTHKRSRVFRELLGDRHSSRHIKHNQKPK